MNRWLRSLFAWKTVLHTGVTTYQVNAVTGRRRFAQNGSGYQPIDQAWLETGQWHQPRPPSGPSCIPTQR